MASKKKEMINPLQEAFNTLKESTAEEYVDILKDEWNEMLEWGREPIIEFDNGDYYYIEPDWENKRFYAGIFNAGIIVDIPMDPDMNLDEHIAELFETAIDMDPSLLVDDDWNDPDTEVEFVNIGEDIDTDSGEKSLKKSDASDFSLIKNNAIETARRDGYDQVVTLDDDGSYTIHRDYPDNKFDGKIVGRTKTSWNRGVQNVRFIDESSKSGKKIKKSESRKLTERVHRASPAKDMIQEFFGTDLESTLRNYFGDISRYDFTGRELKMSFAGEKDIRIPKALQQMADEGLAEIDTASRIFGSYLNITFPHLSSALSLEYDCREEKCTPDDVVNTYNLFGKFIDEINGGNTNESFKSRKDRRLREDSDYHKSFSEVAELFDRMAEDLLFYIKHRDAALHICYDLPNCKVPGYLPPSYDVEPWIDGLKQEARKLRSR